MYNKVKDGLINGANDHKSFKELIEDAIRFTFKKPSVILFLGLFLLLVASVNEIALILGLNSTSLLYLIVAGTIAIFVSFYEAGYSDLIFEHSIEGISEPPSIFNYKEILANGFISFIVFFSYMILMMFIQTVISMILTYQTNEFIIALLVNLNSFVGAISIVFMYIAFINLSLNDGKLKPAFDVKSLLKILYRIGFLRFVVVLFIINFADFLMIYAINFHDSLIQVLINILVVLLVTPSLLLFSKRLLIMSALH